MLRHCLMNSRKVNPASHNIQCGPKMQAISKSPLYRIENPLNEAEFLKIKFERNKKHYNNNSNWYQIFYVRPNLWRHQLLCIKLRHGKNITTKYAVLKAHSNFPAVLIKKQDQQFKYSSNTSWCLLVKSCGMLRCINLGMITETVRRAVTFVHRMSFSWHCGNARVAYRV